MFNRNAEPDGSKRLEPLELLEQLERWEIVSYELGPMFSTTSRVLKNPDCRLLKKISEARRAQNRRAEAYLVRTLTRGD
jgi:hypothetical protein